MSDEIKNLVERARAAQEKIEFWSQERVDEMVAAVGWEVYQLEHAKACARLAADEARVEADQARAEGEKARMIGERARQEAARHMVQARVQMTQGAENMRKGARELRAEAVRLRDPAYRARQIAENRARGNMVTDAELRAVGARMPSQADDMERQADQLAREARRPS